MARKRPAPVVDIPSSEDDDSDFQEVDRTRCHQRSNDCQTDSDDSIASEDSSSSDNGKFNPVVYQHLLVQLEKMTKLKKKYEKSLKLKSKRPRVQNKPKDTSTRFSVTTFSKTIDSMLPKHKKVIRSYGFGSLLDFEKCVVPKKFVKWLARLVDWKSGDIILDGKVIPLTKESVHMITGLPLGGKPFPSDTSVGKAIILSKFGKASIPPVSFFQEKLLSNHSLDDEDVLICFIMVAMSSFLCPNSSLVPSYRYFGVFEDVANAKDYDWSGFILQWSLDAIKTFNNDVNTLGGCWYYLAVLYLDFVDFGPRKVEDSIPRITVWKGNMIKKYSELDLISPGAYGLRPVLHISETVYCQKHCALQNSALELNSVFMDKLDSVSGIKLPLSLKIGICKLIESHSINSSMSVNMNFSSIASLPSEMKLTFVKLVDHAYKVDQSSQDLVLKLLKMVSEACSDEDEWDDASDPIGTQPVSNTDFQQDNSVHENISTKSDIVKDACNPDSEKVSRYCLSNAKDIPEPSHRGCPSSQPKIKPQDVDKVMQNLTRTVLHQLSSRARSVHVSRKGSLNAPQRKPLSDISNNAASGSRLKSKKVSFAASDALGSDMNMIDIENHCVPDSTNPFPRQPDSKSPLPDQVLPRFCSQPRSPDSEDETPVPTQQTRVELFTLHDSQDNSPKRAQHLSHKTKLFSVGSCSAHNKVSSSSKAHVSPDVVITGQRTLIDNVSEQCKKYEAKYDRKFKSSDGSNWKINLSKRLDEAASESGFDNDGQGTSSAFKANTQSTGGKVPHYGPRRVIYPPLHVHESVTMKPSYQVTKSEFLNYRAILDLASSQWQSVVAIDLSGVKVTYWSLGESLKPGGIVNTYVVAAFCYFMFSKPDGHPDFSKHHFYFPYIAENLLKDVDQVDQKILEKAFKRSKRARPLQNSNILFFPTFFDNHWFVFAVDIKDHMFVFLDSYYREDDDYHQFLQDRLITSFMFHWDKYVEVDMCFDKYEIVYPDVPKQGEDNDHESGIFAMMSLQHWKSPRSVLSNIFSISDVPKLRIKIANLLLFLHNNTGNKELVINHKCKELAQQ